MGFKKRRVIEGSFKDGLRERLINSLPDDPPPTEVIELSVLIGFNDYRNTVSYSFFRAKGGVHTCCVFASKHAAADFLVFSQTENKQRPESVPAIQERLREKALEVEEKTGVKRDVITEEEVREFEADPGRQTTFMVLGFREASNFLLSPYKLGLSPKDEFFYRTVARVLNSIVSGLIKLYEEEENQEAREELIALGYIFIDERIYDGY